MNKGRRNELRDLKWATDMNNVHPIFQSIIKQHAPALVESLPLQYRGYTIEEDSGWLGYQSGPAPLHLYPTEEGVQDDADFDGEKYCYCGNRQWADCIEEAKHKVDETLKKENQ